MRVACALFASVLVVACVPSFDGMQQDPPVKEADEATAVAPDGGKGTAGSDASDPPHDGAAPKAPTAPPSPPDAAAPKKALWCPSGTCGTGEVCCSEPANSPDWFSCVQPSNGSVCLGGYLSCTDRTDCTGDDVCCLDSSRLPAVPGFGPPPGEVGTCKKTCSTSYLLCNPSASTCPSGKSCTGDYDGRKYCQ
jgi:hypothetical protein